MTGFVDIHSHVLYGLDDGAKTLDESVAMLDLADQAGTTDLVVTPHANSQYSFRPALVAERLAELQARTTVRLHPGCDFHLHADNIQDALAHPAKYTLNHGAYLLVEIPELAVFGAADEIFRQLLEAGLMPIISHPERNEQLRRRVKNLERWVADGCWLQVTASSLTGLFGREAQQSAYDLVARGLAQFVASDAHNTTRRTPDLRAAYGQLCERWEESGVRTLFSDNPAAVVRSEMFDVQPLAARGWRRWFTFGR